MIISILVFLLLLSALVLIHELGHYLTARKFNIKVEEFGFGIPPRAWGKKIGETIYSINWLPIGGFVKLYGEDDAGAGRVTGDKKQSSQEHEDLDRAFFARPVSQRFAVVVAGVVMNAILAVVIFYIYLGLQGFKTEIPLITDHKFFFVNQTVKPDKFVITGVSKNSPAEDAGLLPCTKEHCHVVVKVDGKEITDSEYFIKYIKEKSGQDVTFEIYDDATKSNFITHLTPRKNPPEGEGSLGIVFASGRKVAVLNYETPVQKALSGIIHPVNLMTYQFSILGQLIKQSFVTKSVEPVSQAMSGPVGVYYITNEVLKYPDFKEKLLNILNIAGLLSATLAIFNILPIPALDGGRLMFIVAEWVTGRKVNQKTESMIHTIGMAFLLGLIIIITFKDIYQFFIN